MAALESALRGVGAWLHPTSALPRHSLAEDRLRLRVGIVGVVCILVGSAALIWSLGSVLLDTVNGELASSPLVVATLPASLALVLVSVFAPQALFRTRNATLTEQVLRNPSAPFQPWRSTTITFNAILVGAMVAGLYFEPMITLAFFGLFLGARVVFRSRRTLATDPNARFHGLFSAASVAAIGAAAYAIVHPFASSVIVGRSIAPLVLAAIVALYLELGFNAVQRWVNSSGAPWSLLRDAIDIRRIIVALVSAAIAWLVCLVAELGPQIWASEPELGGSLAGLGCFLAAWLILWVVSVQMWRRDAQRTLTRWGRHQAEILSRMADGSLAPELAARAAVSVTGRMAITIFGATQALVLLDNGRGGVSRQFLSAGLYDNAPPADARSLAAVRHETFPLYAVPGHPNSSSITVGGWLPTGWFMIRSSNIVEHFRELATSALLTPVIAEDSDRLSNAFDLFFDTTNRWPSMSAFEQAVDRMRTRVETNPQTLSLIVGVYSIDDFGALSGGRFEQAAVAQVARLASGFQEFAGHELFLAYQEPGRVWLAMTGGPMIRSGITLLRDLQRYINDHGSVPSARMDIDVHVSVSFGYAVYQVDDFSLEGLLSAAGERLSIDENARNPFAVDSIITYDIRPEDIIGAPESPATTVDVAEALARDRASAQAPQMFPTTFLPVTTLDRSRTIALDLQTGWNHSIGGLALLDPREFERLANRQANLAAEAARVLLDRTKEALAALTSANLIDIPVMVAMPSILLHPDNGHLALPNLMTPFLDRFECARTVALFDTVPVGGGQALQLLADRGVKVAVTAAAAATADPGDLYGWQRWAIVLPPRLVSGPQGVDGLLIQQTVSAIASSETRLIAVTERPTDTGSLEEHGISWVLDRSVDGTSLDDAILPVRAAGGR